MRRFRWAHHLKTSLWTLPLLLVLVGVGIWLLTTSLDPVGELVPQRVSGDPTAAMQILYLIAFSMLTLTGIVLSLLVVAVQLAMGTFSPRIVRQILQDRPSQLAIGLFGATFAHALLSIRSIRTTPQGGTVPGLAVVVAVVLVVVCMGTLIWYLNHITQSLRTAALVGWVADDTLVALDREYAGGAHLPELAPDLVATPRRGVLFAVGSDRLVSVAERAGVRLELLWAVGDFVPTGAALARVVGDPDAVSHREVGRCVVLGPERTLNQDVAYGLRMLVDIAQKSLSSGPFEDPTTVVQAVDRIHDILRHVVCRPLHSGQYHDGTGTLRLLVPTMHWDGFVRLAFDELRQVGAASPQVARRLRSALEDLLQVAPEDRREALRRQRDLLAEQAGAAAPTAADAREVVRPDPSGIGSAADLVHVAPDGRRH